MQPLEITAGIHWVGVLDPQLRIFDVIMRAEHGTTYNSYLVRGQDKVALVDANKGKFTSHFLETVEAAVDPLEIDYVVLNHLEPDHSGALGALLERSMRAKVVTSRPGEVFVRNILNREIDVQVVADGERLDLGGKTLRFLNAPFLHWPDTMFTYVEEDQVLFTCDFLGAHYCDDRLFNDLVENYEYAFRYYFNVIMRPFKEHVRRGLDKIEALPVRVICPSHGPILRSGIRDYLERYRAWSADQPKREHKRLLVFYASSYGNTERMARSIAEGARRGGADATTLDLVGVDLHTVIDDVETADGICVGSCTINGDALEHAWALLSSLATIKVKGKLGAAFGSFGWSGEGPKMLWDRLKGLRFRVPEEPMRVQLVPSDAELRQCEAFGEKLAEAL